MRRLGSPSARPWRSCSSPTSGTKRWSGSTWSSARSATDLFVNQLSRAARLAGDELDALLLENLYQDCERHNRWTVAAMNYIVDQDAANRDVLRDLAAKWNGRAEAIIASGSEMIAANVDGLSAQDVSDEVLARWAELKWQAGLSGDA